MKLVECHSGYEYAGRPTALVWGGERLEIEEVLGSWRTPDGKRFRVRTADQRFFELAYNEPDDEWVVCQV